MQQPFGFYSPQNFTEPTYQYVSHPQGRNVPAILSWDQDERGRERSAISAARHILLDPRLGNTDHFTSQTLHAMEKIGA